ncbi:hypothetical protein [Flindersiella endophytica]
MEKLLDASFSFPAVIFSVAMILVIVYWLIVLIGALDIDLLDPEIGTDIGAGTDAGTDADADSGTGIAGLISGIGLGGVPVTVSLSLLVAFAWFAGLAGTVVLRGTGVGTVVLILIGVAIVVGALVVGWMAARVLVLPLRRLFPDDKAPSRHDFVGKLCLIKTSRVDTGFGQAEVTAADGSTALIQVRRHAADEPQELLATGSAALIFEYDIDGEFFWVTPYDQSLDPDRTVT